MNITTSEISKLVCPKCEFLFDHSGYSPWYSKFICLGDGNHIWATTKIMPDIEYHKPHPKICLPLMYIAIKTDPLTKYAIAGWSSTIDKLAAFLCRKNNKTPTPQYLYVLQAKYKEGKPLMLHMNQIISNVYENDCESCKRQNSTKLCRVCRIKPEFKELLKWNLVLNIRGVICSIPKKFRCMPGIYIHNLFKCKDEKGRQKIYGRKLHDLACCEKIHNPLYII